MNAVMQPSFWSTYSVFLIIGSVLLFSLSDTLAANWGKNNNFYSLIIMFFIAPIGYVFFGLLNKDRSLASSSGIVNMGMLLATVMVSIFYFGDSLSAKQAIGLLFALLAIYLLA